MLEMFKVNEICSIDNVIIDAVVTYKTICDAECIVANQRLKCCGIHSMHPYAFYNNQKFSVTRKKV